MAVPTGNWGDGWSATANLREAATSSPGLTATEKIAHPHAVVARFCSQEQLEVIENRFEDIFIFMGVEVTPGIDWMDKKWACEVISPSCFPPDSPGHDLWLEVLPQCQPDGSPLKEAWRDKAPARQPGGSEAKEAWLAKSAAGGKPGAKNKGKFKGMRAVCALAKKVGQAVWQGNFYEPTRAQHEGDTS